MSLSDLGIAGWCSATFASDDDQLEFDVSNSREAATPVQQQKPLKTVVKHGGQEKATENVDPSGKAPSLLLQTTIISSAVVLASSLLSALLGQYWGPIVDAALRVNSFIEVELFVFGTSVSRISMIWAFPLTLALAFYWRTKPKVEAPKEPVIVQQSPMEAQRETSQVEYELPEGASLIERISEVLALPDAQDTGNDSDGFSTVHTQDEPYYCYVEKRSVKVGSGNEASEQWMSQWRITVHIRNHSANEVYNVMGGKNESEWNSQCTGSELMTSGQRLKDRGLELVRCTYAGVPLTISAREVLQFRTCHREGDRSLLAFTSTGTDVFDIAVKDGYTRAHQHLGGWLIEPLPGDPTGTLLKVISCVDPGGYVPVSILNWMGWRGAVELCASLNKFLEKNRN